MSTFFSELQKRNLVKQVTDPRLESILDQRALTLYSGFDPTSDSLHVGNLLQIALLRRFQDCGHRPIALIGGATGRIGDPSGKNQERSLLDEKVIEKNIQGVEKTLRRVLDGLGKTKALYLNNEAWMNQFGYLEFLRDVGKHFSVNQMMHKDSVKARLEDREQGISYTEFSYMLIQAYDFYHLNQSHQCQLQIGGSDQWGNITAGCELIRRLHAHQGSSPSVEPMGLTSPLITKSDGSKYGKSEKGAVWLDPDKTAPYEFYQFFIQTGDDQSLELLRLFTFLPLEEIAEIEKEFKKSPENRLAQKTLAFELTCWIHGESEAKKAKKASETFFQKSISDLTLDEINTLYEDAPSPTLNRSLLESGLQLVDLLVLSKIAASKGAARRDIQGGGIYLNDQRTTDPQRIITAEDLLHDSVLILKRGKKRVTLVRFQ